MSGAGSSRVLPHRDDLRVLRGAHTPGQPVKLWECDRLVQTVQEEEDEGIMSRLRKLLHFIYSKGK
jgi:hypothetical protein